MKDARESYRQQQHIYGTIIDDLFDEDDKIFPPRHENEYWCESLQILVSRRSTMKSESSSTLLAHLYMNEMVTETLIDTIMKHSVLNAHLILTTWKMSKPAKDGEHDNVISTGREPSIPAHKTIREGIP